jgi:putative oxidoreductase
MTHVSPAVAQVRSAPGRIVERAIAMLDGIPYWFIALAARIFPAAVFWQSGETKVAGWHLKPSAIALFENEYQLPLIDPSIAAQPGFRRWRF